VITVPPIRQDLNFENENENENDGHRISDAVRIPEGENATRRQKRNAESMIRNCIVTNSSRTDDVVIGLNLKPLKIPSFVDIMANAGNSIPAICRNVNEKNDDNLVIRGESMLDQWNRMRLMRKTCSKKSEWDEYVNLFVDPLHDFVLDMDVVKFWKLYKDKFPNLFNFARLVCCRPTSTGSVERLFSLLGNMSCRNRNRTKASTMELLTIYKEECNRRSLAYPENLKIQRMRQKSVKESKRKKQPVGSLDPSNYMTEGEAMDIVMDEDMSIEREGEIMNIDDDNDTN